MKKSKTKSILACAVLFSVMSLGNVALAENVVSGNGASVGADSPNSCAIGDGASVGANSPNSNAIGRGAMVGENSGYANAIGDGATVGENSSYANAIGDNASVNGRNSNAIGDGAIVNGRNSNAIGQSAQASGAYALALGDGANAGSSGAVALGNWSVANRTGLGGGIYELSVGGGTDTNSKTVYRVITNVAAGTADTDVATYGQVKNAVGALSLSLSLDNKLSLMNGQTALQTVDLSGLGGGGGTGTGGTVDAYTKTETDTKLAEKANVDDVYTKTEVDTALGNKANTADVYAKTETYSKTEVNTELAKKANSADVYTKEQTYSKTEADTTFTTKSYVDSAIEAVSGVIVAPEDKKAAFGTDNEVAKEATAIGHGNKVTGENSVAVGAGHQISGKNSGAFGDPNTVSGTGSYAFGNDNTIGGNNSFVLGNNVNLTSNNAVVLGNNSADGGENTVSVGSETLQRKIVNVADGEYAHDAATYGQLQRTAGQLSSQIDRMGTRISKVGAGAAALAALHPLDFDPDNKLSFSVGVGNYRSENAAALGVFYRPVDRVMFSMGATMGNDNNMVNAGVTFALDRKLKFANGLGSAPLGKASRETLVSEVQLLNAENTKLNNKVKDLDDKVAKLMKVIEELKKK